MIKLTKEGLIIDTVRRQSLGTWYLPSCVVIDDNVAVLDNPYTAFVDVRGIQERVTGSSKAILTHHVERFLLALRGPTF